MNQRKSLLQPILAALAVTGSLHAAPYYWDGNDTSANADGGAGTWQTGLVTNWDDAATGGTSLIWPTTSSLDDDAIFGGVAGTVTISGGVTANSLTFTTTNYTLTGGTLTLDGTTPSITNDVAATINSDLSGTGGLNKIGNGTLTLGGSNSGLSGTLLISGATSGNNGGVILSGTSAFGSLSTVDVQNNSFLRLDNATLGSGVGITLAGGGGTSAPEGALRGGAGTSVVNGSVTIANAGVRVGNLGTSTTFNGAVTAATGSGFGLLIRRASNQGVIFTNTSNYWEGVTQLHDGSHYFHAGALPSATNLSLANSASAWFESNGTFTRAVGTGAGQVQFNSTAGRINGFAARGGDLTVNLGGASGSVTWGAGGFTPAILGLAGANATGTVTWQNPINLGAATRIVEVANGSAATDAIMSGALSNGTLQVQGAGNLTLSGNNTLATIVKGASSSDTGTLVLSGSNTFSTTTLVFGTASQNRGAIRLENNGALGGVTIINGASGTGTAQARIELANNVTISGIEYRAGGRSNVTTTGASIVNISGNNTWAGTIQVNNTGGSYGIRSDAGRLTISGTLRNTISSARLWELAGAGNFLISGNVVNGGTGTLALNKSGTGSLEITGNSNTYTGGTTVSAGALIVNNTSGSATGTGTVSVGASGTLGGSGIIAGVTDISGSLRPGNSIGTLTVENDLTWNGGVDWVFELGTASVSLAAASAGSDNDFLNLTNAGSDFLLGTGSSFTFNFANSGAEGWYKLVDWTGTTTFSASNFTATNLTAGLTGNFVIDSGTSALYLNVIPEPGSVILAGLGVLGLLRRRRL